MRNFKYYLEKVEIENKYKADQLKHEMLLDMFLEKINESSETNDVIDKIDNEDLSTTPEEFKKSIASSKHKEMLSDYSIHDLQNMELYKVPGYNIGYALKPVAGGKDIVSVHNNEPSVKGIGKKLLQHAIKMGGNQLDHFDIKPLTDLYTDMGFKEYQRYPYDPQYDPDRSFANKYGELDVVYRKLA